MSPSLARGVLVTAWVALSCLASATPARAQDAAACDGLIVSRVVVASVRPPFSGVAARWQTIAHAVGLHHTTTRDEVIKAFLSLRPGQPCTEFRRAESERVLRAQPFFSDATVGVLPDSGDQVMVHVTATDEVPVLVSGRFRGLMPEALSLGNQNVGGTALSVAARVERGNAYRAGIGATVEQNALFGRPYRLLVEADRYNVGHRASAEMEHPFFTDLQRISWHAGIEQRDDFLRVARPARDNLALEVNDHRWDASGVLRLTGSHTVTLVGGAVTGRRFDPATAGIVVSDTGLLPDSGQTLRNRYTPFRVGRIGATIGVRRVSFHTVNGFDALIGAQDVATGAMLGVFVARGLPSLGVTDQFFSTAFYAGASTGNTLLATLVQAEARRDAASNEWDSTIGSARSAFYWGSAPGAVLVLADELSGGRRSRLPLQLSLDDRTGGILGYHNTALAGATRNVARAELRWSAEALVRRADVGLATFGEVGSLWAGDAPYGVTATRATVGISVLAAYPTRSKRLYRADIGIPLTRSGEGAGRIEIRLSGEDRTQGFWREPGDVSRARTGAVPTSLFAWPTR